MVDRTGIPLAVVLTGANRHDSMALTDVADAIHPVRQKRGRPRKRPAKLHADKGYDFDRCRRDLRARSITPRIARRGVESSSHLGKYRWVVERTFAWINQFTMQARAAVGRQQAQQPTERAASIKARQVKPMRVKVPASAVKLDMREIEKQAQEKPAPQPEQKPMKRKFDKARLAPIEPRRAPVTPEYVARPAPAPSPSGDVPKPPQRVLQNVPAQTDRQQDKPASAPAQNHWRKATNQQAKAPPPPKDWSAPARNQSAPPPRKDWNKAQEKARPAPQEQASKPEAPRKDWSAPATERPKEFKRLPPRGRLRDRDFDRER